MHCRSVQIGGITARRSSGTHPMRATGPAPPCSSQIANLEAIHHTGFVRRDDGSDCQESAWA